WIAGSILPPNYPTCGSNGIEPEQRGELGTLQYKIMNYKEAPYDQLHLAGLSADYVARETKRAIAGSRGEVMIYPGIDIDVPTKSTDHRTKPDDVRQAIRGAFGAGANGVVLSTRYEEMWLANLSAAGDELRSVFAHSTT